MKKEKNSEIINYIKKEIDIKISHKQFYKGIQCQRCSKKMTVSLR